MHVRPTMIDLRTTTDEQLAAALRARGHRATSQRLVIADALRGARGHVTAEQLLRQVSSRLPGLSLPTVYATLGVLAELGAVRRIALGPDSALYEAAGPAHHHLVCDSCGRVEDLDAPFDTAAAVRRARRSGFAPTEAELVVRGLCADCAKRA